MKSLLTLFSLLFAATLTLCQSFKLPDLPFAYTDYEPFIDAKTMEIHHSKHHQAYVNNLNKAVAGTKLESKTLTQLLLNVSYYNDAVRNNAGGHFNHTLFWEILSPKSSSQPNEDLMKAIEESFGKMDSLKTKLHQAAMSRFGSGWAWLIVNVDGKLQVTSTGNQDNPFMDVVAERGIPILGIDVWEHAYYLKHQNKRNDYIYAILNMLNWDVISQKYKEAMVNPSLGIIRSDNWPELNEFHKVMSVTYHAAEKSDFKAIQERHKELMLKAYILGYSEIPVLDKTEVGLMVKSLSKLKKQTSELHSYLSNGKKVTNEMIFTKLTAIHDTFHEIAGLCKE